MNNGFDKLGQLDALLKRYPTDPVDIRGVILDYLGETRDGLDRILDHSAIRKAIFLGENNQSARLLVATVAGTDEERLRLRRECERVYPEVLEIISTLGPPEISNPHLVDQTYRLSNPATLVEHQVQAVIWQISDIHFGKFNLLGNNPHELAGMLANAVAENPDYRPDIIIMSGDATSIAADEEFAAFSIFAKTLSNYVWGCERQNRFIVIPGNHDTAWLSGGIADRMSRFKKAFVAESAFVTPFSELPTATDSSVTFDLDNQDEDRIPPMLRVTYHDYDLEILLLISGYYTGEVPEKVRDVVTAGVPSRDAILNLLREDHGGISQESLYRIKKLAASPLTRIAVTHHNLCQLGVVPCLVTYAQDLLETLAAKGFGVVMHGHAHLMEDALPRPLIAKNAYALPCTTLSSEPTSRGRGFSIHFLGPRESPRRLTTALWEMAASGGFRPEDLFLRYRFEIDNGGVRVQHTANRVILVHSAKG